ncbi:MAG: UDP-N-acetylmuramate dehydrogenase [Planctomycetaceae bacterium]|jgi:UDP-N-acetylmuramate dehydrogenase|nr:UDP-N-acetylmuramate dehydrogenase [Planctomycetaceae bacterium]
MSPHDLFPQFVRQEIPLSVYTRLQLGGTAEFFAEPENEAELTALLKHCRKENIPVRVLGAGSSLLVSDAGVAGVVVSLHKPEFCRMTVDDVFLTAGAGVPFGQVITQSVSQGLGGIEAFVGMPGSFGGAVRNNTGATHGGDLGQWVKNVRMVDYEGNVSILSKSEITFGYRYSSSEDGIVISATLRLERDVSKELAKRMRKLWIIRKSQQSEEESDSILAFCDPETGPSASELIDHAGLKGTRIGGAVISEHNAGFITADHECTSDDILRLIRLVREEVALHTEIELEPALEIW